MKILSLLINVTIKEGLNVILSGAKDLGDCTEILRSAQDDIWDFAQDII